MKLLLKYIGPESPFGPVGGAMGFVFVLVIIITIFGPPVIVVLSDALSWWWQDVWGIFK